MDMGTPSTGSLPARRVPRAVRIAILLAILAACIGVKYRQISRWPRPAPPEIQARGIAILTNAIQMIEASDFGGTARAMPLSSALRGLIAEDRVVFSAELDRQAMYITDPTGYSRLYLKLVELRGGRLKFLRTWQIVEGAYHEAVHVANGYSARDSVEEECDAYVAEFQAAVAFQKRPFPKVLKIDGMRLADFVKHNYPGLRRDPQYKPIGETREWLCDMAGLDR